MNPDELSGNSAGHVLVVDDDDQVRRLLRALLQRSGYAVEEARSGEAALEIVATRIPDIILLDIQMPGLSGHEVLVALRADPRTRLLPVVMLTGAATRVEKLKAIEEGVTDFIPKPFSAEELTPRIKSLVQLKRFTDALESAENIIVALANTIDARDPYTAGHSARVSLYAGLLGERIGLKGESLAAVQRGGLFHDLGKIAIRDAVLLKAGRLTDLEMAEIRRHPAEGRRLLENLNTLRYALDVVNHHHERLDGSGYPAGLAGDHIPLVARVTTIADIFDALTTARVYRVALSREETMRIMADEVKKGWWDGGLLDEMRGVLETVPEDDPRIVAIPVHLP